MQDLIVSIVDNSGIEEYQEAKQAIIGSIPRPRLGLSIQAGFIPLFSKKIYKLKYILDRAYGDEGKIYPERKDVFKIFNSVDLSEIKVVITAQDPYHNGAATGRAFEVKKGFRINESLVNMKKELRDEGFKKVRKDGNLSHWVNQGVFLLNRSLTVKKGQAGSHMDLWMKFTASVIKYILENTENVAWMLLGGPAGRLDEIIEKYDHRGHEYFKASHPSPLGAHSGSNPFFGSNIFRYVNDYLKKNNRGKIRW